MTPLQIQQHLALPKIPTQIADVTVPAGTNMQVGRVAAQPAFGAYNKGGVQYQLLDQIPGNRKKRGQIYFSCSKVVLVVRI